MAEIKTDIPCPACNAHGLTYRSLEIEIPYFGLATQTTIICGECGYKHNDIIIGEIKEAVRFTLKVNALEDLNIKVVRSSSATICVPELGLKVEPGVAADGYISNIEGVLMRFRSAVEVAMRFNKGTEQERTSNEKGQKILEQLDLVMEGQLHVTIVIEDPFGNSAILSERAEERPLSKEEVQELNTGMNILDIVHD